MHGTIKEAVSARNGWLATFGSITINTVLASTFAFSILSGMYQNTENIGKNNDKYSTKPQADILRDLNAVDYQFRVVTNGLAYRIETSKMEESPAACLVSIYAEKKGREVPASIKDLETDIIEYGTDFARSRDKILAIQFLLRTFCSGASDIMVLKPDTGI